MPQVLQDLMFLVSVFFCSGTLFFQIKCFLGQHTPLDQMMFKAKFL